MRRSGPRMSESYSCHICDDATFIRRASLDITGTLPAPDEVTKFMDDKEPAKRDRLVDQLLGRKEFADLWVMKWAELLEIRSRDNMVYPKAALVYFEWLRDQIQTNVPLDRIVQRYPNTPQLAEVQFRRGELLFSAKQYRPAQDAYAYVVGHGDKSTFLTQSLYKHGWSLFKQGLNDDSLPSSTGPISMLQIGEGSPGVGANSFERNTTHNLVFTVRLTGFANSLPRDPPIVLRYRTKTSKRTGLIDCGQGNGASDDYDAIINGCPRPVYIWPVGTTCVTPCRHRR